MKDIRVSFAKSVIIFFLILLLAGCKESSEISVLRDITYSTIDNLALKLDIYKPKSPEGLLPAVVLIHGGGWSEGDKAELAWLAKGLAEKGYVGVTINYRLLKNGQNRFPAQLIDVQQAVRWIRANGKKYAIDTNRIGAIGVSAGGHLAAFLGVRDNIKTEHADFPQYSSRVNCVVVMYGPMDFTLDPGAMKELLVQLLGTSQQKGMALYKEASPIYYVGPTSAPFLIFHGTNDQIVPIEHAERMSQALRRNGVEVKLITFAGEDHGIVLKENQEIFAQETLKFLSHHLKPQ